MMYMSGPWILIFACSVVAAAEGPQCPSTVTADRCRQDVSALDEFFFYVNGIKIAIIYNINYLYIKCQDNVTLESEELPRFERAVQVDRVKLSACAPPPGGYALALRGIGVTVSSTLQLVRLPPAPRLLADHLRGLRVGALVLEAADEALEPEPSFLEPLSMLRDLRLSDVALSPAAASLLPTSLRSLTLQRARLASLPAQVFARLPLLTSLRMRDDSLVELDLSGAPALREVAATAPLEGVTLARSLESLTLEGARSVRLLRAQDDAGAALRSLVARRCNLTATPPQWLAFAPDLTALDLSFNSLDYLTGELIGSVPRLETLDLSDNRLTRASVEVVAALPQLRTLRLDRNPLGDLCGDGRDLLGNALSPLWRTRSLRLLGLARTGAARLCADWRVGLRALASLDLRHNRLERLDRAALQWSRAEPSRVDLRGNPLRAVTYSRADYSAAVASASAEASRVTLLLDSALRCDCGEYWYARALREAPLHAALLSGARCARRPLAEVPLHELLCDVPEEECPRGCTCRTSGEQSELECADGELTAVPRVEPPLLPPRVLRLARNNISHLAADDVPRGLRVLDLRDNRLTELDADTARALAEPQLQLNLSGNPLRCSCGTVPALRLLAKRSDESAVSAECMEGELGALPEALRRLEARCVDALWPLVLAGAALCAAAASAVACLARPAVRHRLKAFLAAHGVCVPADDDAGRDFDVFVSYSHVDAARAEELQARLERGARARRLLLHERDWAPGELIPAQIAASVRRARRTLALVSPHYVASRWARAELREACAAGMRDARPRLLVVLLPGTAPAAAAAAEPALRDHLAAVTYLRWEDPRFWERLDAALPAPRAPPRPAPALAPAAAA